MHCILTYCLLINARGVLCPHLSRCREKSGRVYYDSFSMVEDVPSFS